MTMSFVRYGLRAKRTFERTHRTSTYQPACLPRSFMLSSASNTRKLLHNRIRPKTNPQIHGCRIMAANFSVSTTVDPQTGKVLAVYLQVRTGKVARTKVLCEGLMIADYNSRGALLGIELLGPCEGEILDQITRDPPVREFLKRAAPRALVLA